MSEKNEHKPLYKLENHMQSMNRTSQIEEEDDGASGESIDNPHIRFETQTLEDRGVVVSMDVMDGVQEAPPDSTYAGAANSSIPLRGEGIDQLTLSFQGEVYVFDAVSTEKVQAVLLLLGGYEVPSGVSGTGMASPLNQRNLVDSPRHSTLSQREASLHRFRLKRKERNYDKKVRYNVRKEVALRMKRKKGQFTSSKVSVDDTGLASNGNGTGQDEPETLCTHCGTSSKSTPMMRRGPSGPRTLCNACGLMWANKGTLRDLSKTPVTVQAVPLGTRNASAILIGQTEVNGSDGGTSSQAPLTEVASKSNGDKSAATGEQ